MRDETIYTLDNRTISSHIMSIPPLPQSQRPWSVAAKAAYQKLYQVYHTGISYVNSGSVEAHRLQQYGQMIIVDAFPLLLLLTETAESESIPLEWIDNVATEFTALLALIDGRWMSANEEYVLGKPHGQINLKFKFSRTDSNITVPQHIHTSRTRKRGRPRKNISPEVLHDAFQRGRSIPTTVLASILGIDRKTLRARKNEMGIDSGFDEISDNDLDNLVREYRQENPAGGRGYVIGRLRAVHLLRIQQHRVSDSMNRIDRLGQAMKQRVGKKKEPKVYQVPRPNALWHIDGHHKLIAWGIVIHGVADGYSRMVCIITLRST
jgi:hypothetical protein